MIISSLILANSIKEQTQVRGTFDGSLHMNDLSTPDSYSGDILMPYEAGAMLGYDDFNALLQDITAGKIEGIPYTIIANNYVFSKKALEEWLYNRIIE